jgi:hypothetical protein
MAIAVTFTPIAMSYDQYDQCINRLEKAGAGSPPGRLYHACYGSNNQLRVLDVWDSQESFAQFGQTLMPILQELGIDAGQPEIGEVHNLIQG